LNGIQFVYIHRPLTDAELLRLLAEADDLALSEQNWQRLSSIQQRLADAIPGMTCPDPVDGPASDRLKELNRLYVTGKKTLGLLGPKVVARFQELTS
jgi:hypothetical protein